MNGYVCCDCGQRFAEIAARVTHAVGFELICCPHCGSDDVEDAHNLETIQAMKREARAAVRPRPVCTCQPDYEGHAKHCPYAPMLPRENVIDDHANARHSDLVRS